MKWMTRPIKIPATSRRSSPMAQKMKTLMSNRTPTRLSLTTTRSRRRKTKNLKRIRTKKKKKTRQPI